MERPKYTIVENTTREQKIIDIGYRKVTRIGNVAFVTIPSYLKDKLLGKYVRVRLIVDAEDLGET